MNTIKCFWAGQLVSACEVEDDPGIETKLEDLQGQLKSRTLTHISCRHTFVLAELCVDVMFGKKLIFIHNLKA